MLRKNTSCRLKYDLQVLGIVAKFLILSPLKVVYIYFYRCNVLSKAHCIFIIFTRETIYCIYIVYTYLYIKNRWT